MVLHIKDKGLYLKIPGFTEMRTPISIDIEGKDLDHILTYLRKEGILNYHISGSEIKINLKENKNKKPEQKEDIIDKVEDTRMLDKLASIERILIEMSRKNVTIGSIKEIEPKFIPPKKKSYVDDEELKFIPEVNIDSMKIKKVLTSETKLDKDVDINDLAKLLSEI